MMEKNTMIIYIYMMMIIIINDDDNYDPNKTDLNKKNKWK